MYKNQLQELAQRSCFNLPSYACIREGPDHGPRFKATVNFNGEMFESPAFFSTLRQAEHAAAEVALNTLAKRGPSRTLAAKVLDETGVYKNLLQETAHRAGLNLPVYTTMRSGPGHVPVFSSTVELGGMCFTGELSKTKKQAQKNAAMSAWFALKQMSKCGSSPSPSNSKCLEEQEQVIVARFLANLPQSNQPKGHPNPSITVRKPSILSTSTSVDSHHQYWAASNFTTEMAMHSIWLQKQAAEHHRHLMALGVSIPPVPPPRPVIPWMQPYLHPANHPFPITPLYLPNQLAQDPMKTRSMVTIQEIRPESSKLFLSKFPIASQKSNIVMDHKLKECKEVISSQMENVPPVSPEVDKKGSPEHASDKCASSGVHGGANPQNLIHGESSMPGPNFRNPGRATPYDQRNFRPTMDAPRMQSGLNLFSTRPLLGRTLGGGFNTPFMAPAVQIRSVVPVCSAAPPRKVKGSSQERPSTDDMRNSTTSDVSSVSSDFGNLHV